MMFGLISRRRFNAEIAALRGYNNAPRERCELAEANERTERAARRAITRQHAELDATSRRLEGTVLELGRRISRLTEADPEHLAAADRRVDRLLKVAARLAESCRSERARADRLQQRLDDAVGLPAGRVEDSARWQPGYQVPKAGGS